MTITGDIKQATTVLNSIFNSTRDEKFDTEISFSTKDSLSLSRNNYDPLTSIDNHQDFASHSKITDEVMKYYTVQNHCTRDSVCRTNDDLEVKYDYNTKSFEISNDDLEVKYDYNTKSFEISNEYCHYTAKDNGGNYYQQYDISYHNDVTGEEITFSTYSSALPTNNSSYPNYSKIIDTEHLPTWEEIGDNSNYAVHDTSNYTGYVQQVSGTITPDYIHGKYINVVSTTKDLEQIKGTMKVKYDSCKKTFDDEGHIQKVSPSHLEVELKDFDYVRGDVHVHIDHHTFTADDFSAIPTFDQLI